ncbi:unnamed protein product [Candidula unifasciata]|uniref:G-protein coupled receptors family 1 profile domain-containing protein n=1 Tax=Candidula unifasciata TaxID=100452 RepID=A0A8S3ZHM5_9EUPU|nr:unnamed protein product [Candidula unifasciata]
MASNASTSVWEEFINTKVINILDTLISCYLLLFTTVVGIVGNSVTLIVLCRIGFKDASNIILLSLAGVDLFFLIQLFIRKLSYVIEIFDSFYAEIYRSYTVCYLYVFDLAPVLISISHIVVISTERLLAVFFPLRVCQWFTRKSVTMTLISVYLTWIIALQPWVYSHRRVEWGYNANYNRTYTYLVFTEWYISNAEILTFFGYIIINSVTGMFCLLVATMSCAIAYRLHILTKRRSTMTFKTVVKNSDLDLKVSRMLLVVCVVYCFCNIPSFVIYFGYYTFPVTVKHFELNNFLRHLEEVFMALNCTANFFIYVLMSSKFHGTVIRTFHVQKS